MAKHRGECHADALAEEHLMLDPRLMIKLRILVQAEAMAVTSSVDA